MVLFDWQWSLALFACPLVRGIKGHDEKFIVDKVSVEFGRIYIADLNH